MRKISIIVLLLTVILSLQGGQPTHHSHRRKQSISMAELSKKYNVEIKQVSTNEVLPVDFGRNFSWLLNNHRNASNFLEIQEEIAHEAMRRSPEEREHYLQSIHSLTEAYPEWLDMMHQQIAIERSEEIKTKEAGEDIVINYYNTESQDSPLQKSWTLWQPGEIEKYIWEKRHQLLSEDMADVGLED